MSDDGAIRRPARIDEKIAGGAIKPQRSGFQQRRHFLKAINLPHMRCLCRKKN
jgi:hypothetical protein